MQDVHRIGFTHLLSDGGDSNRSYRVNIVFVHGLRGHPKHTWEDDRAGVGETDIARSSKRNTFKSFFGAKPSTPTADIQTGKGSSTSYKLFWPDEYLTYDIPEARVWTYGYNADVIGGLFQANNTNSVSQHGRDLAVRVEREIENTDPILFVAHSLGGIIVKDAILRSDICRSRTKLIVFLGTPHRASLYTPWGKIAANLVQLALQDPNKKVIETLEVNSEVLDNIHDQFKTVMYRSSIKVHSFQEGRGISGIKGLNNKVVDDFSSKLDLPQQLETVEGIDANHMQMAKCRDRSDPQYRAILGVLRQFLRSRALSGDRTELQEVPSTTSLVETQRATVPSQVAFELPNPPSTSPPAENEQNGGRTLGYRIPGWTILHSAALNGDAERVATALRAEKDLNCKTTEEGWTPLYIAALYDCFGAACVLTDAGANIDASCSNGATALFIAATKGHARVVQELLKRGARVNTLTAEHGLSPLIGAAAGGHTSIVRMLIDAGADTRIQRRDGHTALHISLSLKNVEMAEMLLEDDRAIHIRTEGGDTPLLVAAVHGLPQLVGILLDLGAEIDAQDLQGYTALRVAVQLGHLDIVRTLIDRGARTNLLASDGLPLLEVASMFAQVDIFLYLEQL